MYNFTFEYEADGPKKPDFGFVENIHGNHGIDVYESAVCFVTYEIDTISCLWYSCYDCYVPVLTESHLQVWVVPTSCRFNGLILPFIL